MNKIKYEKMIDEKIATLKEELIEELMQNFEEECKNKFPKFGEIYWYIGSSGEVYRDTWDDVQADRDRLATGNIFRTKEEAEFELEKRKVIAELKKYTEPKDRKWDGINKHFYFRLKTETNGIYVDTDCRFKTATLHFESLEKTAEAIRAIGEDRIKKYYLGIDN